MLVFEEPTCPHSKIEEMHYSCHAHFHVLGCVGIIKPIGRMSKRF